MNSAKKAKEKLGRSAYSMLEKQRILFKNKEECFTLFNISRVKEGNDP